MKLIQELVDAWYGVFVCHSDLIQWAIVDAESPTTVFLLHEEYRTRERAPTLSNNACSQHHPNLSLNLGLLSLWISERPHAHMNSPLLQCDRVCLSPGRRQPFRLCKDFAIIIQYTPLGSSQLPASPQLLVPHILLTYLPPLDPMFSTESSMKLLRCED